MQKIIFKQQRDFGKVFADTLKFIKQNFRSLFGSIVFIAGPLLLISGFALGYTQASIQEWTKNITRFGSFNYNELLSGFGVAIFFAYIGQVVLISVTFNYMMLYHEKPEGEAITIQEVAKRVMSNFWNLMGSMFTLLIVTVIITVVIVFVFAGLGYAMGVFGWVLIALAAFFGIILTFPVLAYYITGSFFVCVRDGDFIFAALGKTRRYLKGNYWWTWLIMLVAGIAIGIVNLIFTLPASVVSMADTFTRFQAASESSGSHSTLFIILSTVANFCTSITSVVYLLICAFNFLGQEEKHEGAGLFSRIDEIK